MVEDIPNVIFENRQCGGDELHIVYSAMDRLVSASGFETLGNILIESWVHDKPVPVLPEQGHKEYLRDGYNGFANVFLSFTGYRWRSSTACFFPLLATDRGRAQSDITFLRRGYE